MLDTNIIIALLKGESLIAEKIDKAENIYIPVIVIGELYYGSLYSSSSKKNFEVVERLARRYNVLQID
ncbi:MAG TPA: PIN domain-containing protein, partial [Hanamia sp.]|nr:PIN domain-containing protein [Hanamia sp.]